MSKLKEALSEYMNDLLTNEVAIVQESENGKQELMAYARISLEGDSVQWLNSTAPDITELSKAIVNRAMENRKASWQMITKALG